MARWTDREWLREFCRAGMTVWILLEMLCGNPSIGEKSPQQIKVNYASTLGERRENKNNRAFLETRRMTHDI